MVGFFNCVLPQATDSGRLFCPAPGLFVLLVAKLEGR